MSRDTVTIIEDETFNYLLFCSGVFSLDKKEKQGDRHFSHSPIGARTYEYHYSQWDHYAVIRCSPIAAEKLMLIRNHYHFPSPEEMHNTLHKCEDYPDAMCLMFPDWEPAS